MTDFPCCTTDDAEKAGLAEETGPGDGEEPRAGFAKATELFANPTGFFRLFRYDRVADEES